MSASLAKRAPFRSGVTWYSLWNAQGNRAGWERHVVSAVSDGSATIETVSAYSTAAGKMSEGVSTLAFGTGGVRLEAIRSTRDGAMSFSIRRDGDAFSGVWMGKPFSKRLPADVLPNFGLAEWIATLPQEPHRVYGYARLAMGADVTVPAMVECVGDESVDVGGKKLRGWKFVDRVGEKVRNTWWVDANRIVVKYDFGLVARVEESELAAKGSAAGGAMAQRPSPAGIAGFDDPTKVILDLPKPMGITSKSATAEAVRAMLGKESTLPAREESSVPAPGTTPSGNPNTASGIRRAEHLLPAIGRAPSKELAERGEYAKGKRWYSLTNNGQAAGWESHFVNTMGDGALLETESHYLGADNTWHDSSAVVVFSHDRISNCHFMQDGIQTELGQPFFTLRRIETGFIGTWQGKPYKRVLPEDFVPGFGLHEWVATLPQSPGAKKTVQRLAMAQLELVPSHIECHGEQETDVRGVAVKLCKFLERVGDKVRSIWWIDRNRVPVKYFFGMTAVLEATEEAAKVAGTPKE